MIKMVVCDMDGTLLSSKLEISVDNLKEIQRIREKGIRFCIATGRPEQLMKEYWDVLDINDVLITSNGSVVSVPKRKKILQELYFQNDDLENLITYCEKYKVTYLLYTKDKIISKPNYRTQFFKKRNESLDYDKQAVFEDIRDLSIILSYRINKVLILETDPTKYRKIKEECLGNPQFQITTSNKSYIDINPKGATKGNALRIIANHYGYKKEEIVSFGDQDNDLSMLRFSGTSIAMGNATVQVKEIADYITESNNDSGVAKWLNRNIK